jgi:hypothetical protein
VENKHEKVAEAQALLDHYSPEIAGLCRLLAELVENGDRWNFTFMCLTIADLCKQAAAELDKSSGTLELADFCRMKWH